MLPCDVSSDEQMAALAASIDAEAGGLDFVVHGVGFAQHHELSAPFVETKPRRIPYRARYQRLLLIGLTRAVLPLMEKRGGGSVLTLSFSAATGCSRTTT